MDINQSSLSRYKSTKSSPSRTNGYAKSISEASRQKDASSSTQNLKQLDLKEGQIVKGQIIDRRYNEVSVQLEPGKQVITAKLTGDIPLSIGQNAQFQVTEEGAERYVLKYLPSETAAPNDVTIQKALAASNLPMTERNKAIVSELLSHRMPINKQTLQNFMKLSIMNREASPLTLVLMYKNQILMTPANIKQFEAYQNGTNQLLSNIQTITKNISELLKQPSENIQNQTNNMQQIQTGNFQQTQTGNMQQTQAGNLQQTQTGNLQQIQTGNLQQIQTGNLQQIQTEVTINPEQMKGTLSGNLDTSEVIKNPGKQQSLILNQNTQWKEAITINEKLLDILYGNSEASNANISLNSPLGNILKPEELSILSKALETAIAGKKALSQSLSTDLLRQLKEGTISLSTAVKLISNLTLEHPEQLPPSMLKESILQNITDPSASPIITKLFDQFTQLQGSTTNLSDILSSNERMALLDYMNTFPNTENIKNQITDGTATIQDVLKFIQQNLPQTEQGVARSLLQSPEYTKLLEEAFHQKWTITPEKLAKKEPVTELYQNLSQDLEKLSNLAKAGSLSVESLRLQEPVKNLQDNLQFLKDINEIFTYLQLPVQFRNKDVHSELYVFTKKKAMQDKRENLSVLLHLDMANLGPLNIHIQMNQSTIQAKFFLKHTDAANLIEQNLTSLTDNLQKKGYNLQAEVIADYEKPDFSKDFIEESSQDNFIQRFTFDIRT